MKPVLPYCVTICGAPAVSHILLNQYTGSLVPDLLQKTVFKYK
ncbi:MAG: hypothetical protein ABIR18_13275 [Chitinophagaceae bacterium]